MKKVEIQESGPSDSVLAGNGGSPEWVLVVSGGVAGSSTSLEASINNRDWFEATSEDGPVSFTKPEAVLVSAGLYYRLNVGTYSSTISLEIKPN